MRIEAQDRIMSLSFERDPQEHAAVMLAAGRRLRVPRRPKHGRHLFIGFVLSGIVLGLVMELYRQFVLTGLLHINDAPPLGVLVLQLAPILLLLVIVLTWMGRRHMRQIRLTLIERTAPGLFIDTDIYRQGLRSTCGPIQLTMEWNSVRDVIVNPARIDVELETYVIYLPERAFADRKAFDDTAKLILDLWQESRSKRATSPFASL